MYIHFALKKNENLDAKSFVLLGMRNCEVRAKRIPISHLDSEIPREQNRSIGNGCQQRIALGQGHTVVRFEDKLRIDLQFSF